MAVLEEWGLAARGGKFVGNCQGLRVDYLARTCSLHATKEETVCRSWTTVAVVAAVLALAVAAVGCGEQAGGGGDPQADGDETDEAADTGDSDGAEEGSDAAGTAEGETLTGEFKPLKENSDRDISGQATLTRTEGRTILSVDVSGLESEAAHPAHLHLGTCADMGPHYQDDAEGAEEPPNELWPSSDPDDPTAGLQADADGEANGEATAEWRARDSARAVFIHAPGEGHDMIACADLEQQ